MKKQLRNEKLYVTSATQRIAMGEGIFGVSRRLYPLTLGICRVVRLLGIYIYLYIFLNTLYLGGPNTAQPIGHWTARA